MSNRELFEQWIDDGNVVRLNGFFATQDALYCNKIESMRDLYKYFLKEFIYA